MGSESANTRIRRFRPVATLVRWEIQKEKGQVGIRPGLLGESAHNKLPSYRVYFPVFPIGGVATSLCCAQAPSPKAVTRTATTMIVFKNFN
jgi:hypothetical protein